VDEPLGNAGTPEERRTGLGGSDAAAALGLSPWQTPYDLWEQKRGLAPPLEQTEPMLWGHLLEDIIRREYAKRTGMEVRPVKELIRHPKHAWMFAHLDGKIGADNRAILEVKCARTSEGWGEPDTSEVPLHYLLQIHHYLSVTAAEVCDVAVLIGGSDFRLYQVERDPEIEEHLVEGEAAFWQQVEQGVPPAPMTLEDAVRRWGHSNAQGFTLAGVDEIEAVYQLRSLHQQKKDLLRMEEGLKLALTTALGENGANLVHPGGELLATWKLDSGRKGYSVAPKEPSRRLLIKGLNDV
jgi:putative phage-type endonuclease